jgi:hypothetical protein
MKSVILVEKVFNRTAYALERKSITGLDKLDVQILVD